MAAGGPSEHHEGGRITWAEEALLRRKHVSVLPPANALLTRAGIRAGEPCSN